MSTQVTLTEAATFLGVSKATLRNWDKDGKLSAVRNPVNGYRLYNLDDLIKLKQRVEVGNAEVQDTAPAAFADSKAVRRAVFKLNSILRDSDVDSNIITRFDEISKLLFLKLYAEKSESSIFERAPTETEDAYYDRICKEYQAATRKTGIFVPAQFRRLNLPVDALLKCGKELSAINYSSASVDVKGLAYEDIIRGTFDKNDNQQFFTPYQIVDFMVAMMAKNLRGTVCDPACGTAGFLTRVTQAAPNAKLLGLEVDERLAWVSNLNLLIHGKNEFKVLALGNGGSLGEEAVQFFGKIDAILTNPPFGSDYTERDILDRYSLGVGKSSRRRGVLFIEQSWHLLKEKGVVAIIIDRGVLNSASNSDVRRFILDHFQILSIVDLPESAFMPYASVSSSILILKKVLHPVEQKAVFYAKSLKIGRKTNGDDDLIYTEAGEASLDSDLPQIVEQWVRHSAGQKLSKENCFAADVSAALRDDPTDRIDYDYHHPFRKESQELLGRSKYMLRSLAELCTERNQAYIPSSDQDATTVLYTGLASIESHTGKAVQVPTPAASIKSAVKRYEPGDIVFSKMRPGLRKVAVMPYSSGGYVSYECAVFTVRKDDDGNDLIDPYLLSALLRSDFVYGQIMSRVTGIGRLRISGKELRKIQIPLPPSEIQNTALVSLNTALASVRQLREKARLLLEEADTMEQVTINKVAKLMTGETI